MRLEIGCVFLVVAFACLVVGGADVIEDTAPIQLRRLCSSTPGTSCKKDADCCGDLFCESVSKGTKQCAEPAPPPDPPVLSIENIISSGGTKMPYDGKIYYNDKVELLVTNVYPVEEGQFVMIGMTCEGANNNGASKAVSAVAWCEQCIDATAVVVPNKLNSDRPVRPLADGGQDGWIGSWNPDKISRDGPGCDDNTPHQCEDCAGAEAATCTFRAWKQKWVKIKGVNTKVVEYQGDPVVVMTEVGPRVGGDCFCDATYDICNCANGCSPHPNCWYNYYGLCSAQYSCAECCVDCVA